jgi:hypothetical protein
MKFWTLFVMATLIVGCSQSGGGKGSTTFVSTGTSSLMGTIPAFNPSTDFTGTKNTQDLYCVDTNGTVNTVSQVNTNHLSPDGTYQMFTTEKLVVNANNTYTLTMDSGLCMITETGSMSFDPSTRNVTFTSVNVNTNCTFYRGLLIWTNSKLPNGSDLVQTFTMGAITRPTRQYIRFQSVVGFGLYTPFVTIPGDATSKCYIYYRP